MLERDFHHAKAGRSRCEGGRLCGVLTAHNTLYCMAAALLLLGGALIGRPAAAVEQHDGALPDVGEVVEAYLRLRQWVDAFEAPSLDSPDARLPLTDASGVAVILRRSGRVIGSANAVATGRRETDLLARRALGRALAEVLGDPAVANLPEELRGEIGLQLTLELEVAGPTEPLVGRTFRSIARQVEPGIEGVAMRRGNQWAMLFPSQLLATNSAGNITPRLPGLAVTLNLPATELATLTQQHGVSMHRFQTLHLAQARPDGFPFETIRGDQFVPDAAVSVQGIAEFADGLAQYILGTIWISDEDTPGADAGEVMGVLGDYRAVTDTYRPLLAPPLEQALASFALGTYAAAPGTNEATAAQAEAGAVAILHQLAAAAQGNASILGDPLTCAAIVYAASVLNQRDAEITQLVQSASHLVESVIGDEPLRDPLAQALVAGAAARLLVTEPTPAMRPQVVRDAINAAWEAAAEHERVALLPWIGWAELDYAAATGSPVIRADELRQIRALLEEARITAADGAPPDVRGGFVLTQRDTGDGGRPTAQTTRPASFFAVMLRQPELTPPDEAAIALGRHLQTMRFLMQLRVREANAWSIRNPNRALGGIRATPWDSDMPAAAQSIALIAAAETLISLDRSLHAAP